DKALIALNAGWNTRSDTEEGRFNFWRPLSMLLGFCEDYKRLIVNARHELILIQARNDNNWLVGNPVTESEIELFKNSNLPTDPRTLLQTPKYTEIKEMAPGFYWHYGLTRSLIDFIEQNSTIFDKFENTISLSINVDGGPLSRSSTSALWPILDCLIDYSFVFVIGAYHGNLLGLVTNVVLDYLQVICLGTVRKMLYDLVNGELQTSLPHVKVEEISHRLIELKSNIVIEFVRKPRSLKYLAQWKGTEFCQFFYILKHYYMMDENTTSFNSTIQVIPQNWFVDETRTKAYWPNYTNFKTYDKAVESMQDVDIVNWTQVTVCEIIAASDKLSHNLSKNGTTRPKLRPLEQQYLVP
ncbi:hypothetical protein ALC57_00318, partial [Trachymyrmex cornetzi]